MIFQGIQAFLLSSLNLPLLQSRRTQAKLSTFYNGILIVPTNDLTPKNFKLKEWLLQPTNDSIQIFLFPPINDQIMKPTPR